MRDAGAAVLVRALAGAGKRSQRNLMRAMKRGLRRRVCLWRISVVPELRNERLLSARSDIRDRRLDGPILTQTGQWSRLNRYDLSSGTSRIPSFLYKRTAPVGLST